MHVTREMKISFRLPLFFVSLGFLAAVFGQPKQPAFSITINAPDVISAGSEPKLSIVLKNTSDHEIMLGRSVQPDQGELHHDVEVRDDKGDLAPETEYHRKIKGRLPTIPGKAPPPPNVSSVIFIPMKPGETRKDDLTLSKLYDLGKPGKYTIQLSRFDEDTKAVVKSNTITVNVTKP
jgi:hypothetical protein